MEAKKYILQFDKCGRLFQKHFKPPMFVADMQNAKRRLFEGFG